LSDGYFISPARTDLTLRDPTVSVASFRSLKTGWHGEWLKLDDATNEQNQKTLYAVEQSIIRFEELSPLLEPNTYMDFNGTRWLNRTSPLYYGSIVKCTELSWNGWKSPSSA